MSSSSSSSDESQISQVNISIRSSSSSSEEAMPMSIFTEKTTSSCAVTSAIGHIYEAIAELDNLHRWHKPLEYLDRVRNKMYDALNQLRPIIPPAKNINSLPDDCLVEIFSKATSLQSMVGTLSCVCARWKSVVEASICSTKSGLKIFESPQDVRKYADCLVKLNLYPNSKFKLWHVGHFRDNDLSIWRGWIRKNECDSLRFLGDIFSNVKHLVFGFGELNSRGLAELTQLLHKMSKLNHLTLLIGWTKNQTMHSSSLAPLTKAINSLCSLKRLDLLDPCISPIASELAQVLPQLSSLSLVGKQSTSIDSIIGQLGDNFLELRLDDFLFTLETFSSSLICTRNGFASRITHLRLSKIDFKGNRQVVQQICSKFTNLKRLELSFDNWEIKKSWYDKQQVKSFRRRRNEIDYSKYACARMDRTLIANLAQLAHLQELSLSGVQLDLDSLLQSNSSTDGLTQPGLPNIKSFHLSNILCTKDEYLTEVHLAQALAAIFSNLEQLDFQYGKFFDRGYFHDSQFTDRIPSLRKCRIYWFQCSEDHMARHQTEDYRCSCIRSEYSDSDNSEEY